MLQFQITLPIKLNFSKHYNLQKSINRTKNIKMFFQKTVSQPNNLKEEIRPIAAYLQKLAQVSCEKKMKIREYYKTSSTLNELCLLQIH